MPILASIVLALLVAAPPTPTPTVRPVSASIEQAIRKQKLEDTRPKESRPSAAPQTLTWKPPTYNDGRLYQEITVSDWFNSFLIMPEFRPAKQPVKGFGVPRGGQRGSPSFDTVSRKFWWE
jgi:hypothetical protein